MIALLLAAQVAAAQPALQPRVYRMPLQRDVSEICKGAGRFETSQPSSPALLYRRDGKKLSHKLNELPKPDLEKTVLRMTAGCVNPLIVQFNVGP
jgi:hypothetical protein